MVRPRRKDSIRQKTYDIWVDNPYITAKGVCRILTKDTKKAKKYYDLHGGYINKLLSQFRSYHILGSPQKALKHRRIFVWEQIARAVEMPLEFWEAGWRVSGNRNEMWVFRSDRGTVHWYKGGLVRLYLRGEVQLGKAKELFCRAFSWMSPAEWKKFLDVPLRQESQHWTFEVGAPMPRFDIRQFERSHGLRIYTDGTHPTKLEVAESTPYWIGDLERVTDKLGIQIDAHLELIRKWQEEATVQRHERKPGLLKRFIQWLW